jgi:hypothetical protein
LTWHPSPAALMTPYEVIQSILGLRLVRAAVPAALGLGILSNKDLE